MKKIKILVLVFCLLLATLISIGFIKEREENEIPSSVSLAQLVQWIAKEMKVEAEITQLPRIILLSEEELYERIASKMELQLGKNSKWFEGFTAIEVVRGNEPLAYYCMFTKNIYLFKGAPDYVLAHEVVHFIQDIYQKRAPQIPQEEIRNFLACPRNASGTIALNKELEKEAEAITEKWKNRND